MRRNTITFVITTLVIPLFLTTTVIADSHRHEHYYNKHKEPSVQLGPRPFFSVNDMDEGKLKKKLQSCSEGPFERSNFSIGYRGAAQQFPEHTKESYEATARLGAGI